MNKNIVVKTISAALSMFVLISVPSVSLAEYVQNRAVTAGALTGLDIINADGSFTSGMDGWDVTGGNADVSDGEMNVTTSG